MRSVIIILTLSIGAFLYFLVDHKPEFLSKEEQEAVSIADKFLDFSTNRHNSFLADPNTLSKANLIFGVDLTGGHREKYLDHMKAHAKFLHGLKEAPSREKVAWALNEIGLAIVKIEKSGKMESPLPLGTLKSWQKTLLPVHMNWMNSTVNKRNTSDISPRELSSENRQQQNRNEQPFSRELWKAVKDSHGSGLTKQEAISLYIGRMSKMAADGLPAAQYGMGTLHYNGEGVPVDFQQAMSWWIKASEQGHADAQYWAARCYLLGKGVPKDNNKAIVYLEKSSAQGHAYAQNLLGKIFFTGISVPKNYKKALPLLTMAAENDMAAAQTSLGWVFRNGLGTTKNIETSMTWFRRAAENEEPEALHMMGLFYLYGNELPQDHLKAINLLTRSAQQGFLDAQFNLGTIYLNGKGIPKNASEASMWFRKAADKGHLKSLHNLVIFITRALVLRRIIMKHVSCTSTLQIKTSPPLNTLLQPCTIMAKVAQKISTKLFRGI